MNSLSSIQLDAFQALSKTLSFTQAAAICCISQSALSQRIAKLEQTLGSPLFIRPSTPLQLTPLGEKLLRYCTCKQNLEHEFLSSTISQTTQGMLTGIIRLAGFSSIMQSMILPMMSQFIKQHPNLWCEFQVLEIAQLSHKLAHSEVDFILSNAPCRLRDVINHLIGHEVNVLVEPKNTKVHEFFLDHDPMDTTTTDFFAQQKKAPSSWKTRYFDDIYLIIEAVKHGLGRAIIPRHLLNQTPQLKAVEGYQPMITPIYLSYIKQAHKTRLHQAVISHLINQSQLSIDGKRV